MATLSREEARREIEKLTKEIKRHNALYFQLSAPEISDEDYDLLLLRLKELEKLYPDLRHPQSPTLTVGAPITSGLRKIKHLRPMISLENAFSVEELEDFFDRARRFLALAQDTPIDVVAEPKIDGVSATLHYQNGHFVLGATRGDGQEGEDITVNLKTIKDIPLEVKDPSFPHNIEIRGEVFIDRFEFEDMNKERQKVGLKVFANPRNAASGSLRQLDPEMTAKRHLKFFAYFYFVGEKDHKPQTQEEILTRLKDWGFPVNPLWEKCASKGQREEYLVEILEMREQLSYEIDGAVYKINRLDWQERLGNVGKAPRHSVAYKFLARKAETILEDIVIQVGRTGVLTPVAVLKPVPIGGVIVSRATLHNSDEIERKGIRIGDWVEIQRAGDVIPQITGAILIKRPHHTKPFAFPTSCPACGGKIVRKPGEVAFRCMAGLSCPAQAVERLKHFVSRYAFDIDGLGEQRIIEFYEAGLIKTPADIFTLEERNAQLHIENRPGWGALSAQNLFQAIRSRRIISLDRFVYALGIPQIGEITARVLARHYRSLVNLIHFMKQDVSDEEKLNELIHIEGFGESMAYDLLHFFKEPYNLSLIEQIANYVQVEDHEDFGVVVDSPLMGKAVVFTGTLSSMSRPEAKAIAERLGARVMSSVSKKVNYLICGEDPGSKRKEAEALGVSILTEEEWKKLIS